MQSVDKRGSDVLKTKILGTLNLLLGPPRPSTAYDISSFLWYGLWGLGQVEILDDQTRRFDMPKKGHSEEQIIAA